MQIILTVTPQPDGQCAVTMQVHGLEMEGVEDTLHVAMGMARHQRRAAAQTRVQLAQTLPPAPHGNGVLHG